MIKNFDNFVKESREFKPHRAYGIGGYKFKVYNKEDYEGNDDTIEVHQRHPNMGMLKWFTIDKNSIFHTDTSATEEFVLGKMIEILEPSLPNNQVKYKEDNKKITNTIYRYVP